MPHPFIRRAGALSLLAAFCMPQAGALSDISAWAQADIVAAQAAGLMPSSLESLSARGEITRAEFCGVAVNAYKTISGKAVFASGKQPFRDCDDPNVTAAYELGLISGRGDGYFDPDSSIERQDLCVMLYNILDATGVDAPEIAGAACIEDYPDVLQIKDYALDAVVTMVDYAVVNGISAENDSTLLSPSGTATREQALIMANRFCDTFADKSENSADDEDSVSVPEADSSYDPWLDPDFTLPQTEEEKMALVYGIGGENIRPQRRLRPTWLRSRFRYGGCSRTAARQPVRLTYRSTEIWRRSMRRFSRKSTTAMSSSPSRMSDATPGGPASTHRAQPWILTGMKIWKRPSTPTVPSPRRPALTGHLERIPTPFRKAAMCTTPSPSMGFHGAVTPGRVNAIICISAISAGKCCTGIRITYPANKNGRNAAIFILFPS